MNFIYRNLFKITGYLVLLVFVSLFLTIMYGGIFRDTPLDQQEEANLTFWQNVFLPSLFICPAFLIVSIIKSIREKKFILMSIFLIILVVPIYYVIWFRSLQ